VNDLDRELYERAAAAAERAYAPYSRFTVGAAARTSDGQVLEGVNVENAAYPLGICAERAALARAVEAGYGPGDIDAVAVTASPCGGCRQWLVEFRVSRVVYQRGAGDIVVRSADELLPDTFQL
jgi:cytidine deaminase